MAAVKNAGSERRSPRAPNIISASPSHALMAEPPATTSVERLDLQRRLLRPLEAIKVQSKRLAFVALYLHRLKAWPAEPALAEASAHDWAHQGLAGAALNKARSEARALIEYGRLGHLRLIDIPLPVVGAGAEDLLARAVQRTSLARAAAARSAVLQGASGGRRPKPHARALHRLLHLKRLADGGDTFAKGQLQRIEAILAEPL